MLMGPHEMTLDAVFNWRSLNATRVVYCFDTLPFQFRWVRSLLARRFDLYFTSFADAVPLLEPLTRSRWHAAEQAVPIKIFVPAPPGKRVIDFAAYGRRNHKVHEALLDFCEQRGLYYDFSTHACDRAFATAEQIYRNYAWHLCHVKFAFCWPVELTSPNRAGGISPFTCRWFEVAAAGAVAVGAVPRAEKFLSYFDGSFVQTIDDCGSKESICNQLEALWINRDFLLREAAERRARLLDRLDWSDRVEEMIKKTESLAVGEPAS
ncbi:MAG: glycosyltransferase [Opitutaceae bacterium]